MVLMRVSLSNRAHTAMLSLVAAVVFATCVLLLADSDDLS